MSTSLAYHTQGIIGFQHQSYEFSGGVAIQRLIRKEFRCPRCFHSAVKTYPIRTRRIQGLPYGTKTTFFELDIHRIYCPKCSEATVEEIPFISHPKARITTAFERTIIELRPEMTISAISKHFNLDWRVIKELKSVISNESSSMSNSRRSNISVLMKLPLGMTAKEKPHI